MSNRQRYNPKTGTWEQPTPEPVSSGDKGNRVFLGEQQESRHFGFNPAEVNAARELLGSEGNAIQHDGSVKFTSRSEQRDFAAKYERVKRSNEQRVDEQRSSRGLDPIDRS